VVEQIAGIGRLAGASVAQGNDYPPWEPNPGSALLETCKRVYRELFREEAHVAAIHAGLETGIIGERMGAIDMVSLGPRITGAHSPDERVYVRSVEKSWRLLTAILKELAKA
jgi:dipeptidase D